MTLNWANLSGVNFLAADLTGAELRGANLTGAKLVGAVLAKANLSEANLATADLRRADLAGTVLSRANLTDADLTDVTGLELDSTRILHARFSPRANDKWSILRRTYTGPNMVLNLIFVLLFFVPLIVKGGTLAILANAQHRIESVKGVEHSFSLSTNCKEPQGIISATVDSVEIFHVPCRAEPVWKLLLGSGGPFGAFMPALTAVLIAYQIVRFLLTRQISLMRDAEERSGVSPPKAGRFTYPRLFRVHQALSFVFLIAVVAFALRAYEFLFLDVIFIGGGR